MRDDRIDEDLEDFAAGDLAAALEPLEAGAPDEPPPAGSPLSQREIDDLVDQVLAEELKRLNDAKGKE